MNEEQKLLMEFDDQNSSISSFIVDIDRGGLFVPEQCVYHRRLDLSGQEGQAFCVAWAFCSVERHDPNPFELSLVQLRGPRHL